MQLNCIIIATRLHYSEYLFMAIIRKTKTVNALLQVFEETNDAISIVELVNKFNGIMDKTTVYRILERLEDSNLLHSFIGDDGLKRYAKWVNEDSSEEMEIHPHFQCNACGKSSCLPIKISLPSLPDYKIESIEQTLSGKCKDCF